jgi:ribosome-associated protein
MRPRPGWRSRKLAIALSEPFTNFKPSNGTRSAIVAVILSRSEVARESSSAQDSAEALSLARRIVDLASDKQASDIVLLDIRGVSLIADYFVICTAGSERQASAILNDLGDKLLEEFGRKPLHTEGKPDSGWVLLDFGDVIVHVFSSAQRTFYKLEELWAAATPIVRLQ